MVPGTLLALILNMGIEIKDFLDICRIYIVKEWVFMGRSPRIEYYGAIYHIIHRGNNKSFIFELEDDKMYLLQILSEVKELFDFTLLAYVIMDNHYHLLIKTHNIPISRIMHRINTRYAKHYNKKYERSGSPFEDRYRGLLVENESYLIRLIKYIHNNPVHANICSSMNEYKWSSDVFYRMNLDNIVNIYELLNIFSEDRSSAIERYQEVMKKEEELAGLRDEFEAVEIIGREEFREKIKLEIRGSKHSLDDILRIACPKEADYKLIRSGSRKRYLTQFKQKYIKMSIEEGYTTAEIAESLNMTSSAINNLSNRCLAPK